VPFLCSSLEIASGEEGNGFLQVGSTIWVNWSNAIPGSLMQISRCPDLGSQRLEIIEITSPMAQPGEAAFPGPHKQRTGIRVVLP
jgi:hypothetical protein